ncbi:MAG: nucleotidyltransferase domain-containing protein [Steroidobacteraceae bacterium]
MNPEEASAEILARLRRAENEHAVRILLAVESGSRAWGFASPDSDYDVRFIYAHDPAWYQSVDLEERRDVIEYPIVDDIDLHGWDVRKALRLFWKSNPAFVEWIQSPVVYMEEGGFRRQALEALPRIFAPDRGIYHYRSMARTNYRGYLKEPVVRLKKYFYVLRPLLAARWIENTSGAAPIEFGKLLSLLSDQPLVLDATHSLLEKKRHASEIDLAPAVPVLNEFIETELAHESPDLPKKSWSPEVVGLLNEIFRRVLGERGAPDTHSTSTGTCGTLPASTD